jgi:hypothetical protein
MAAAGRGGLNGLLHDDGERGKADKERQRKNTSANGCRL